MSLIGKKVEYNNHSKSYIGTVVEKTYRGYKQIVTEFMIEDEQGNIITNVKPSDIIKVIKPDTTWNN